MTVNEIYKYLEKIAPFKYQESYDNSGFLIGNGEAEITKICVCLDITLDIIAEAAQKGANLIISHHPVIFNALSAVKAGTPVFELIKNNINAICFHTNFDGVIMSDIVIDLLGFPKSDEFIREDYDEAGAGKIVYLTEPISALQLAEKCKKAFGCSFVKYTDGGKPIKKIAICAGAGGSFLDAAIEKQCDAYIAGEVRYDNFIRADYMKITLIEAGHYHTENPFCGYIEKTLREQFPQLVLFIAENNRDVCKYL